MRSWPRRSLQILSRLITCSIWLFGSLT
jgi:hypothetical protein